MEPTMTIDHVRKCFVYGGGVMPARRPGLGVGKYNAESPKQGSKMVNFITKTIHFAHLGIFCIYSTTVYCTVFSPSPPLLVFTPLLYSKDECVPLRGFLYTVHTF